MSSPCKKCVSCQMLIIGCIIWKLEILWSSWICRTTGNTLQRKAIYFINLPCIEYCFWTAVQLTVVYALCTFYDLLTVVENHQKRNGCSKWWRMSLIRTKQRAPGRPIPSTSPVRGPCAVGTHRIRFLL